jgi:hypothetical protein
LESRALLTTVAVQFQYFNSGGTQQVSSLTAGQDYLLKAFVQDVRSSPAGVEEGWLDLSFNSSLISVNGAITHGADFNGGNASGTAAAGSLTDVGGDSTTDVPPAQPAASDLLFVVPIHASGSGGLTLTPTLSSVQTKQFTMFGLGSAGVAVPLSDISFAGGSITVNPAGPQVTAVSSTKASGTYSVGASIPITVTFTTPVTVTGTPQLTLNDTAVVNYSSGSGTSTLTFNYTVAAGQNASDLDYNSTSALSLNGGSIKDASTNNAILTLPATGSDGLAQDNLVIDTAGPTVSSVATTAAAGSYGVAAIIPITVKFNEPVTVTGTPQLTLNDGAVVNYSSGSGGSTLTFNYTVAAGQNTTDLDYASISALSLNGGTIKDSAANSAILSLPATGTDGLALDGILVDTTNPSISSVSTTALAGTYGVGASIPVTVTFSEPVLVTGTPQLALNAGGGAVASYTSGSGGSTLTFTYLVAAGQSTADLDYTSTSALSLNSGSIKDAVANNAVLTLPATNTDGLAQTHLVINTTSPAITSVSTTAVAGKYGVGASIPVTITFSEPVNVTGTPQLTLNDAAVVNYSSGSGGSTLTFNYTVAAGQNTSDLDYNSTSALSLNGGTIKDASSNNATLTLPATGTDGLAQVGIVIDTSSPTVSSVSTTTLAASTHPAGDSIPITVTFNEPVTVTGVPQLTLNAGSGAVASYTSGSGGSTLTFTYLVAAGQSTADLDYLSTSALGLNGGSITDTATNNAVLTLPATGTDGLATKNIVIAATVGPIVTQVSTSAPAGLYGATRVIPITVAFSTAVSVTGTPQLTLNDGAVVNYASGSGTNTLTFNYTVATGENTAHLDYASATALALNGGTIQDSSANPATLTLPGLGTTADGLFAANIAVNTMSSSTIYRSSHTPHIVGTVNEQGASQVSVEISGITDTNVDFTLNADVQGNNWSIDVPVGNSLADGYYMLTATSSPSQISTTALLVIDTLAPVVTVVTPQITNHSTPTITGTVSDPGTTSSGFRAPGQIVSDGNGLVTVSIVDSTNVTVQTLTAVLSPTSNGPNYSAIPTAALADGTYTVQVVALDDAGNSSNQAIGTLIVDIVAPTVTVDGLVNPGDKISLGGSNRTLTGTVNDAAPSSGISAVTVTVGTQTFNATVTGNTWSATLPPSLADGAYSVQATAVDNATNSGSTQVFTGGLNIDTTPPTITSVDTTATSNSAFNAGKLVTISVTFSEVVNVTGTPQLTLNDGAVVNYASGSGTSTLTFTYTVAAGQNTADLDYASITALALNGGAIQDAAGNSANLALSAPDTGVDQLGPKNVDIDTVNPTATVDSPVVTNDNTPTLTGTVSDPTPSSGNLSVSVVVGGQTPTANVSGGTWSVNVPTSLPDGTYTVTATASDAAGNNSSQSTGSLTVDTVAPTVSVDLLNSGISTPALTGTINDPSPSSGIKSAMTVIITGVSDTSFVPLNISGVATATSWTASLPSGVTLPDGVYTITATVTDNANNAGTSTNGNSALTVDTKVPEVTVDSPVVTNDTTPTLSGTVIEPVSGVTIPNVIVTITGAGTANAGFTQQLTANISGTAWSVVVPTSLADGFYHVTASATDSANKTGTSDVGLLTIDSVDPAIAITNSPLLTNSSTPIIVGTFSDAAPSSSIHDVAVAIFDSLGNFLESVTASVNNGTVAFGDDAHSISGVWSATATTLADGTYTVVATVTDNAGNTDSFTGQSILTVDTTAPTITSVATTAVANSAFNAGKQVIITVTFSENVTVAGAPQLTLNDGAVANYTSGSGTSTLTFSYTVAAGQNTSDLDYSSTTALSPNGGAVQDAAHNNANLALATPGTGTDLLGPKDIDIDTVNPTVTIDSTPILSNTNTPIITGTVNDASPSSGIANVTLFVFNHGSSTPLQTIAAVVSGTTWSATLTALGDGTYDLQATIADNAENTGSTAVIANGLTVDTNLPTVTAVATTAATNSAFNAGKQVTITVTFSENVNVTGTPQLTLNDGAIVNYASGTGTSTLTFVYTVTAGQNTSDLDYNSTAALSLNGGTIQDSAHNDATLTLSTPGTGIDSLGPKDVQIDTVNPAVTISGTPIVTNLSTATITGTVTDASPSSGISGVTVTVNNQTVSAHVVGSTWTAFVPKPADGTYDVTATATDDAGNSGTATVTGGLIIDTVNPTVTVTGVPIITNDNTPTIMGTVTDASPSSGIASVTVVVGGQTLQATITGSTWSATLTTIVDGTYDIVATAVDNAGNSGQTTATAGLTVDTVNPTVTITGTPIVTNDGTPTISGTVNDASPSSGIAGVTVVVGGQTLQATITGNTWSVTAAALTNGTFDITATATDKAGNNGQAVAAAALTVDTANPTVTITGTPIVTNDNTPMITGTVTDASPSSGITDVTVLVAGQTLHATITGTTWSVTPATVADGKYDITATATDAAGNSGQTTATGGLTVDTQAPVVTVNPLTTGDSTPTLTGTISDPAPSSGIQNSVTVVITGAAGSGFSPLTITGTATATSWTATVPPGSSLPVGTYFVVATVTDNAGNPGSSSSSETPNLTITVANSSLAGFVYLDAANDGQRILSSGAPRVGIGDITLTLQMQQTDGTFQTVGTTLSGADGSYGFSNLAEGTYQILETPPTQFIDGVETAGSLGGTPGTDKITGINVQADQNGTEYNFSERGVIISDVSKRLFLASTPITSALVNQFFTSPAISLNGSAGTNFSTSFTAGGSAVPIANTTAATITHSDGAGLDLLTVTITNPQDGANEALSADPTVLGSNPDITASYNSATNTLTLSGAASAADYQAVLRTVKYNDTSATPSPVERNITFVVSDPLNSSNVATTSLTIQPASSTAVSSDLALPSLALQSQVTPSSTGGSGSTSSEQSGALVDSALETEDNWLAS